MKEVIKEILGLIKIDLKYAPSKIANFLWRFHAWYSKRLLDGNAKLTQRFMDYDFFRRSFVTRYMEEQGYSVPAVTRVVLKNNYQSVVAIHFFNPDHLVIDREKSIVKPVYTSDLLQTDYYLDKKLQYE